MTCRRGILAAVLLSFLSANHLPGADNDPFEHARKLTKQADQALREGEYGRAADLYEKAIAAWAKVKNHDSNDAAREAERCRNNLVYALQESNLQQFQTAKALQQEGKVVEAATRAVQVAKEFAAAYTRCADPVFLKHRDYCYSQAGLWLAREADRLRENRDYAAARDLYRRASDVFSEASNVSDNPLFQRNTEYVRHWMFVCRFKDLVQKRADMPAISAQSFADETVSVSATRGRVLLVIFWAEWCPRCKETLPEIAKLYDEYHSKGLDVVGVSLDSMPSWSRGGSADRAPRTAANLPFPNVRANRELCDAFGRPDGVPYLVWIDRDGRLTRVESGGRSLDKLERTFLELNASE